VSEVTLNLNSTQLDAQRQLEALLKSVIPAWFQRESERSDWTPD